ncbi:MAG: hypothetical protein BWY59_00956 [Verrucomicrobia bacterium ADurb.Bin345]|nr:MAG: hypothetical protein BWY59_00956 [Verrucomicrobia bacterium ADurb.Bin345]
MFRAEGEGNHYPMTRQTPFTLLALLLGGIMIFLTNAFFQVPTETYLAMAGGLVFVSGLLFGVIASIRALRILLNPLSRQAAGTLIPTLTILITLMAWTAVINTTFRVKHSMEEREEVEEQHWNALHAQEPEPTSEDSESPPVE